MVKAITEVADDYVDYTNKDNVNFEASTAYDRDKQILVEVQVHKGNKI